MASMKGNGTIRLFVSGAALSLLAACGGSGGIGEDETTTHLRVFNAIGDSPSVQFVMDTTVVATAGLGGGSAYSPAPAGSRSIQLRTVRPGRISGDTGSTDPVNLGTALTQTFADDADYTVIAAGTMAAPQLFTINAPDQRAEVAATKLIWRLVHAVPGGQQVDLYLTAPEAGIAAPQFITSMGYQSATDTRELTLVRQPGEADTATLFVNMTFELRATGSGTVLFNSGPLQFNERNRLFFAIVPNAGAPDGQPFQLATMGIDGSSGLSRDPADPATVRMVNLSHDAPALDLVRLGSPQQTLATNIAYGGVSTRTVTPNGSLDLVARATADTSNIVFVSQFTSIRDQAYSIYGVGPLAMVDELILGDDRRVVPTQTRFRFVHAAGSLSDDTLDVYLTRTGVPIDFNSADDTVTADDAANVRQASALPYRAAGGYVSLEGGTYDVYYATAGATTTLIGPVVVSFPNGGIQTVVLTESAPSTLEVRVVDDTLN
jgi:hypothetical protein